MSMREEAWLREGLLELVGDLPFEAGVGVEVGSYAGESVQIFANSGRFLNITCVDTWHGTYSKGEPLFDAVAAQHPGIITKLKLDSVLAARRFADASLDFVYIDANHEYNHVRRDILSWRPKVKMGGVLAGHDYSWRWPGVLQAVHESIGTPHRVYRDASWFWERRR